MKSSIRAGAASRLSADKGLLGLVLVALLGLLPMAPAQADRDDNNRGNGRQAQGNRDRDRGDRRPQYRQPYYRPYSEPVYVPPPVYYQPQQSPGISLFFPLDLRR